MTDQAMTQSQADIIRITNDSSRAEIERAIAGLRDKQKRMPVHWQDRREEVAEEIAALVLMWLAKAPE